MQRCWGSRASRSPGSPTRERRYRIFRTDRGFRVEGNAPEGEELEAALRAAGARTGAEVEIGDETFELA